ncbi:rRNA adenine N-6-methyltransferase family protein [Methanospirillum stamsii]|uniref:Protein-L-isoaspartate carboxylmethyltransferase n=1 Tax=Methanospirillum stamsii TaxID=1277351 RepID=A0A2V2NAU1_9EURY|nr:rRNA adenine N-6-methyltransferase family protein [Methanospirillum stamsii]PWR73447.1 protein-L-isoaspartate carboxylmethyltransferase [Methanospirillum stamsii]
MISTGDRVILSGKGKNYVVRAGEGSLGTDLGMVDLSLLLGKEPGDIITTKSGKELFIRLPRATDFFEQAKRSGAPMLPRDIGLVIGLTGMNKHDHVLDAGTGSGVAAVFFAGIAGRVTTCERREEFYHLALENIRETGLPNIEVLNRDVLMMDGSYDIVHLDLGITQEHVVHAFSLIRAGGYLVCYTPFFEQMGTVYDTAMELFSEVSAYESIMRDMDRSLRGTRPSTKVCHSGYLTVARR